MKKLRKGLKVSIPDIVRYRFERGAMGVGREGTIDRVVKGRDTVYVHFEDDWGEDILWYDFSEVEVL